MKRLLLAAAVSLLTAGSAMAQTVVLVRHGEKADAGADPVLSEAGQARASALALVLADFNPELILISPLQRTRMTADPTAAMHGLNTVTLPVSLEGGTDAHVARVVAEVRLMRPDSTVLVVGHSNTVPAIARALGHSGAADMADCEYDRLTVLDLNGESTAAVVGRYGTPTTCE